jgi:tetratricopeptide (TPR) repeat protein
MNIHEALPLAFQHLKDHSFKKAERLCREILSFYPDNVDALHLLGLAYYKLNNLDLAITFIQKAIQIAPTNADAHNNLGIIFRDLHQFDDAIGSFYKALQISKSFIPAYLNLRETLMERADIDSIRDSDHLDVTLYSCKPDVHLSILISVAAFNRKSVTQISLSQTKRYKPSYCHLQVYNDHSTEYDNAFLKRYADEVIKLPSRMGIDNLRYYQFRRFLHTNFDLLYMTDTDVIHDPLYIKVLQVIYEMSSRKLPVCLFNSKYHVCTNLYSGKGILLRQTAPGVSMLYDKKMVETIVTKLDREDYTYLFDTWDCRALAYLGLPWIMPERSYLEHYGAGGINNDDYETDRAINPTQYLQLRRESILDYLMHGGSLKTTF